MFKQFPAALQHMTCCSCYRGFHWSCRGQKSSSKASETSPVQFLPLYFFMPHCAHVKIIVS